MNQQEEMQQDGAAQPQNTEKSAGDYAIDYSDKSKIAVVFGILGLSVPFIGLVFCPMAWSFGQSSLKKIEMGILPASKQGDAKIGRILGIIGTLLYAAFTFLSLLYVLGVLLLVLLFMIG